MNLIRPNKTFISHTIKRRFLHNKTEACKGINSFFNQASDTYYYQKNYTIKYYDSYDFNYCLERSINDFISNGLKRPQFIVNILYPKDISEEKLKELSTVMYKAEKNSKTEIKIGDIAECDEIREIILNISAFCADSFINIEKKQLNADIKHFILMTDEIALSGTGILAEKFQSEFSKEMNPKLVKKAIEYKNRLSVVNEVKLLKNCTEFMYSLDEGGIFKGLWEISKLLGCGFEVDLDRIRVNQETIEICELLNINPYKLLSDGSLIIIVEESEIEKVKEILEADNIPYSAIGYLTNNNNKIIKKDDRRSYLEKDIKDELEKFLVIGGSSYERENIGND